MIPIGELALYLAALQAFLLFSLPLVGIYTRQQRLILSAKPLAFTLFVLITISFFALMAAFAKNDFSYIYVATHSNTQLPWFYQLTAVWGGHEGSMLLWVWILTLWTVAVTYYSRALPPRFAACILAILGVITLGFIAFLLLTSNPFNRQLPFFPLDGRDLNPLLQDIGLIIHPPLLYLGYVGFAVPFAFVCAALLLGNFNQLSIRWVRPWALAAWGFLTLGITVGSWWAYYELGWGGYWFWDPVENASLMPWIIGTALLHALAMTEQRAVFPIWSVFLAILSFSLSLLGTFLVRSGVLTSVHSFAADPARGSFILALLGIITGSALLLLVFRTYTLIRSASFALLSRESFILINNIILCTAFSIVFLGTLFPLIVDVFALGKISVGAPYFNALMVPLTLALLGLLGIGPLLRFRQDRVTRLLRPFTTMLIFSIIIGCLVSFLYAKTWLPLFFISVTLASWALSGMVVDIYHHKSPNQTLLNTLRKLKLHKIGMLTAHFGFIVMCLGATFTSHFSTEKDVKISIDQHITIENYTFTLMNLENVQGSNFIGTKATVKINAPHWQNPLIMFPEKRIYTVSGMPISEVALRPSLLDDLYVAMGEELDNRTWAMRIYVKPMVRWIWLGGLIMTLGSLLALIDKRYRLKKGIHLSSQTIVATSQTLLNSDCSKSATESSQ